MQVLEGKKIFIIEDDPGSLSIFMASMTKSGANIKYNVLGYDIIDHVLEFMPVDLIILDITLRKKISGYDVYEQVRAHALLKHIPVVIVTSMDWEEEIPRAKAKGLNGFIAKPINIKEFPLHIAKVIKGENIWVA